MCQLVSRPIDLIFVDSVHLKSNSNNKNLSVWAYPVVYPLKVYSSAFLLLFLFKTGSLCNLGWPGICCIIQAGFEHRDPPTPAFWLLGLKMYATMPGNFRNFLQSSPPSKENPYSLATTFIGSISLPVAFLYVLEIP